MRVLSVLCGVAVLLVTLAYGHLLHHYFVNTSAEAAQNPVFWLSFSFGLGVGVFSFIGGAMLVRRGR